MNAKEKNHKREDKYYICKSYVYEYLRWQSSALFEVEWLYRVLSAFGELNHEEQKLILSFIQNVAYNMRRQGYQDESQIDIIGDADTDKNINDA